MDAASFRTQDAAQAMRTRLRTDLKTAMQALRGEAAAIGSYRGDGG